MTSDTADSSVTLTTPEDEARAFQRLQWRLFRMRLVQAFATSRLRFALVIALSVLLWLGLFHLVHEGFAFMRATLPLPIHERVVQDIFSFFFMALFLMLIFSTSVILYGSLFRTSEVAYLLTLPIHEERIFQHEFQHAVLLSSWGFVLLGSPMLVAYGLVSSAPWYYYAMLLPMLVAFVFVPAGLGAILLMAVMRFFPRQLLRLLKLLKLGVAAVVIIAAWFMRSIIVRPDIDMLTPRWFTDMLHRLELTKGNSLPNWWLSTGLLESAHGVWSEGVLFLALLIANALFFRELAGMFAARTYRRAYWTAAGIGSRPARVQMGWFDRGFSFCLGFLSPQMRLILLKDVRLFRRDPLQWSQFLILVGLLLIYFFNVHPVGNRQQISNWVNIVSFMNLSVVGLLMSTFTTRFVFPMISLECRRFWLLGLLPLKRDTILWAKFLFSVGSLLVPCALLIMLSDWRLRIPLLLATDHQVASMLLCLGLSGIGVGLGARLPLINEQSPSRIAAGFGGTLNLVVSTFFIVLVLALTALPCHVYIAQQPDANLPAAVNNMIVIFSRPLAIRHWLVAGTIASVLVSLVAAFLPMWIGIRTFRRQEFH